MPKKAKALALADATEIEQKALMAEMATDPSVNAAAVIVEFGKFFEKLDMLELAKRLSDSVNDVWANNMRGPEAMLYSQARALQAIFVDLSRRATTQEYLKQWEAYLRMALKAQNQCRMTLETLAAIKNPPVVFARQANIAHGPQQVNNGMMPAGQSRAGAGETEKLHNELLEEKPHERLDTRTTVAAVGADTRLAAVGENDRTEDAAR